jgi:two-component system phosphate regulon response regulator PhoB
MTGLVLVVEDERDICSTIEYNLQRDGLRTVAAYDGSTALAILDREPLPDAVVLDLMLPEVSGTEVCRRIRRDARTHAIPVVMLTARGEEIDRVVGFELGADDYVVKPFSVRELVLRVRAALRRSQPASPEAETVLAHGPLRVDLAAHRVWVDDDEVALTALEFRLLVTLLQRRGRVQTRDRLLTDVWDVSSEIATRTVDTHVKRLRQKLGGGGALIETLRGVGYRLVEAPIAVTPGEAPPA